MLYIRLASSPDVILWAPLLFLTTRLHHAARIEGALLQQLSHPTPWYCLSFVTTVADVESWRTFESEFHEHQRRWDTNQRSLVSVLHHQWRDTTQQHHTN